MTHDFNTAWWSSLHSCTNTHKYSCSEDTTKTSCLRAVSIKRQSLSLNEILFCQKRATGRFKLLESDGVCAVGESIQSDDVYINKSTPLVTRGTGDGPVNDAPLPDSAFKPTPQKYKGPVGETCVVDRVQLTTNDDSTPTFKVQCDYLDLHLQSHTFITLQYYDSHASSTRVESLFCINVHFLNYQGNNDHEPSENALWYNWSWLPIQLASGHRWKSPWSEPYHVKGLSLRGATLSLNDRTFLETVGRQRRHSHCECNWWGRISEGSKMCLPKSWSQNVQGISCSKLAKNRLQYCCRLIAIVNQHLAADAKLQ